MFLFLVSYSSAIVSPWQVLMLLPFQGATATTRDTQGVASLALGYVLHWAFSPHLLKS